jgi:omega-6 fatty acid desaturase (delta-12 desaturase)
MNSSNSSATPLSQSLSTEELKELGLKLARHCMNYRDTSLVRSFIQLFVTMGLFLALFALMYWSLSNLPYYVTLLLAIPTGGFLVRLFIIQHDCGHKAFFKSVWANDMLGRFLSVFTVTPYDFWKRAHAIHHASCGNLDKRGIGDITTLTVEEYRAKPFLSRMAYRLYRNPAFLFFIGVPLHFAFLQRLPFGQPMAAGKIWKSVIGLDIALVVFISGLMYWLGVAAFLKIYLPTIAVAAFLGGWMFFIQHQYEEVYWEREGEWNFHLAGIAGSSYYVLPKIVQWLTGNIGLHHIHHLNSAIPNYRLQECLDDSAELFAVPKKLTFWQSLKCLRLSLWDEAGKRLVSFAEARTIPAAPAAA